MKKILRKEVFDNVLDWASTNRARFPSLSELLCTLVTADLVPCSSVDDARRLGSHTTEPAHLLHLAGPAPMGGASQGSASMGWAHQGPAHLADGNLCIGGMLSNREQTALVGIWLCTSELANFLLCWV